MAGKTVKDNMQTFAELTVSVLGGYTIFSLLNLARSPREPVKARVSVIPGSAPMVPEGVRVDVGASGAAEPEVVDAELLDDEPRAQAKTKPRAKKPAKR